VGKVNRLVCVKCGKTYPFGAYITCPACGLEGILDVEYDYDLARRALTEEPLRVRSQANMFRYLEILPVDEVPSQMLRVGWTPLYRFDRLSEAVGHSQLYLKDETVNPSGSLKDRASAVGIAVALREQRSTVACASTGNAASSLAVLAASAGLSSYIFVPEDIPLAKLYQIATCATKVFRVRGTYEDAFDVATGAIARWNWFNRNCAINPYLVEGKKTCSLEIYEQLGYRAPDWIVVSVGDGCIISGQYKAFKELQILGEIPHLPRLLAVQAEGASPIVDAFNSSGEVSPVRARTIADSIRVGKPRNWRKALRALKNTQGVAVKVSDDEILDSISLLGHRCGIFAEPAGAAGFAGFLKARKAGIISADETVVVIITGSGLKDPSSVEPKIQIVEIEASEDAVEQHLS